MTRRTEPRTPILSGVAVRQASGRPQILDLSGQRAGSAGKREPRLFSCADTKCETRANSRLYVFRWRTGPGRAATPSAAPGTCRRSRCAIRKLDFSVPDRTIHPLDRGLVVQDARPSRARDDTSASEPTCARRRRSRAKASPARLSPRGRRRARGARQWIGTRPHRNGFGRANARCSPRI
jgi:hypothetical protein